MGETVNVSVTIDVSSPEARRANELARELLTARWIDPDPARLVVFEKTLRSVLSEVLAPFLWPAPEPDEGIHRVGCLVMGLALAARAAATHSALQAAGLETDEALERLPDIISDVAAVMAAMEERFL